MMEYTKKINLLDYLNQPTKFRVKDWLKIDDSSRTYYTNIQI